MDKEGEISIGGDRIHFYIEKREIEHHYYNFHIYCLFLLILQNQDLKSIINNSCHFDRSSLMSMQNEGRKMGGKWVNHV